jgi:hypothetical protein
MVKQKAAPIANTGTSFFFRFAWTFLTAAPHTGTIKATKGTAVCGLRYPSGICIDLPPQYVFLTFRVHRNKKQKEDIDRLSGQYLHDIFVFIEFNRNPGSGAALS